jgi:hypothetical protein
MRLKICRSEMASEVFSGSLPMDGVVSGGSKAVSPLRFATAVQKFGQFGVRREAERHAALGAGCVVEDGVVSGSSKAVSPLRFATAVQKLGQFGVRREAERHAAFGPR